MSANMSSMSALLAKRAPLCSSSTGEPSHAKPAAIQ
jgi:hypothetical protein